MPRELNATMIALQKGFDRKPSKIAFGKPTHHEYEICHWTDLFPVRSMNEIQIPWIAPLRIYCQGFVKPIVDSATHLFCFHCNTRIGVPPPHGTGLDPKGIDFNPDHAGEGRCSKCGYPLRYHHKIYSSDRSLLIATLNFFPLQYHPTSPDLEHAPKT